jgi:hypothetical protein
MKLACTLAALALLSSPVMADEPHFEMVLMGKSWHFGYKVPANTPTMHYWGPNYNNYNPGIGIEYRWPSGFFVGAITYYDSFRKQAISAYGGYQYTHRVSEDWSVFAALRAGYLHGSGINGPVALPSVGVQYKKVSIELEYIPKVRSDGVNVIGVFGRWEF